ncbi:VOC family protein [Candidatus Dependentiae bacterium]|nr:VOC family protein [Candidatus Dependentiae bacterium]
MINNVTHLTILVKDQDAALKFYTEKLGFIVHTDVTIENNFRWLTISLPDKKDFEIALMPAMTPEQQALVGKQTPGMPLCSMSTSNCKKTYEEFKAHGVEFIQEPTQRPWGIEAIFKDQDGTLLHINQEIR